MDTEQVWLEFQISCDSDSADLISELLTEEGALGVAIEDPEDLKRLLEDDQTTLFLDPDQVSMLSGPAILRVWFPDDQEGDTQRYEACIQDILARVERETGFQSTLLQHKQVGQNDWVESWKKYYHTLQISRRLWVAPTWEDIEVPTGVTCLRLDPGAAFGTGSHETTALCLEALDDFLHQGSKVLDVGTGSGILAIAAAKLGARRVDACDTDPHAIKVAEQNAAANGVGDRIAFWSGPLAAREGIWTQAELTDRLEVERLEKAYARYDLITANLLADIIVAEMPKLAAALSEMGILICSGVIKDRGKDVIRCAQKHGLRSHSVMERNDWLCLLFVHQDQGQSAYDEVQLSS